MNAIDLRLLMLTSLALVYSAYSSKCCMEYSNMYPTSASVSSFISDCCYFMNQFEFLFCNNTLRMSIRSYGSFSGEDSAGEDTGETRNSIEVASPLDIALVREHLDY